MPLFSLYAGVIIGAQTKRQARKSLLQKSIEIENPDLYLKFSKSFIPFVVSSVSSRRPGILT